MTPPAIVAEGVTRHFGPTVAVDDLSLTVGTGEIFGLLGHNGAGKTTTVRLLNGVLTADRGSIRVLGFDPQTEGTAVRARTGVLTETPSLDERLSASDNLAIHAELYGVPTEQVRPRIASILERFGLTDRAAEKVGGYSKGMKQRLALARAFLHQPDLIFLDEPTSGLDPVAAQDVHHLIRHVSRDEGRTVFLCTHNLTEAERLCDRVGVVERGRLVAAGTPRELARASGATTRYGLEIPVEQRDAARDIIRRFPRATDCQADDTGLVLALDDREAIPDILAALLAAGIRVYAVTPHGTSLEDIYLALHQRSGRAP